MNDTSTEVGLGEVLSRTMEDGGPLMWPIVIVSIVLAIAGLVLTLAAMLTRKRTLTLAAALGLGTLGVVLLGEVAGAMVAREATRALKTAGGVEDASFTNAVRGDQLISRHWALGGAVAPGFFSFLLLGIGLSRLPRFDRP